ncbi:MAG: PilZ domain-containing protein [Pseudolabrys sp.]
MGEFEYLAIDHLFGLTMKERRAARRKPLMMTGVIILSERAPRIQCKVIDLSEIGAGLEVPTRIDIPEKFDLVVEGIRRRCRLVRRSGNKIGAAFE